MKPLTIRDAETVVLGLQDEIRRSEESRYDHRLHGVLLVAQGMSCRQVSELLGDAPRTVAYWVRRFERDGLGGLTEEERSGRPRRLDEAHIRGIDEALRRQPRDFELTGNLWDGKTLSAYVKRQWDVDLGARQCQRLRGSEWFDDLLDLRAIDDRARACGVVVCTIEEAMEFLRELEQDVS